MVLGMGGLRFERELCKAGTGFWKNRNISGKQCESHIRCTELEENGWNSEKLREIPENC